MSREPQQSQPRRGLVRDESREESDNLRDPDVLAQEIVEDLAAAREPFCGIAMDLGAAMLTEKINR
ncbi:MAG TPA: hypothetical protein VF944_03880 [Candidatus Bathyarchaeia archaeon]